MSLPTPNYVIMEEYVISNGIGKNRTLPVGSFVRPIEPIYLPDHIKSSTAFTYHDPKKHTYVYCSLGIITIPNDIIRKV